jgi:hypothetical protein
MKKVPTSELVTTLLQRCDKDLHALVFLYDRQLKALIHHAQMELFKRRWRVEPVKVKRSRRVNHGLK